MIMLVSWKAFSVYRYMLGAIIFGILFDRLNRHLLFAVCTFLFAVFNGVKPYCNQFYVMVAVQLVGYVFCGGLDTGLLKLYERHNSPQTFNALHDRKTTFRFQLNFNGWNTFGTMKICSRQG